ncbi:MAG: glycosyltransferase [Treponema sp.]
MKILHIITNTELGGAQTVCISLANMAVKEGHRVAVASMPGGYLWEHLDKQVIPLTIRSMIKPISFCADFKCYCELKKAITGFDPDIIHLHSSKAGTLGRLAGRTHRDRIVYTVHGFDSIRLKHRLFLPLERLLQKRCGAIVAVSCYDEKHLRQEKITHRVQTIRNGIAKPQKQHDSPFHLNGRKKIVMTIARISPQKRFESFLTVALHPSMQNYLFVWVGGSATETLEELTAKHTIPPNVLLLGDYPNAAGLLHYCDIFVLFSNYEGLPMTIIEAMAQKKAVVASNVGGISELVDETNGMLVHTDAEAVTALDVLLHNDTKLTCMGQASYEKYTRLFTLDTMWEQYRTLYCELTH